MREADECEENKDLMEGQGLEKQVIDAVDFTVPP